MADNTLFLRLEGPLQAWGHNEAKFAIRRVHDAPTKSGIIGLLCSSLGKTRAEATDFIQSTLQIFKLGVRIDRKAVRFWDFQTVGALMKLRNAEGKPKDGPILSRKEYLCDASFLVAVQCEPALIAEFEKALKNPVWVPFLGRKCCSPSRPILELGSTGDFPDLLSALKSKPLQKRDKFDKFPDTIEFLTDWEPSDAEPEAPEDAEIWYDVPLSFDTPSHLPRFVIRQRIEVDEQNGIFKESEPFVSRTPTPSRPSADYSDSHFRKKRVERIVKDGGVCLFCKGDTSGLTAQHVTYARARREELEDLATLCRLCHDAVTMIEYGENMGIDRINPSDPKYRDKIIEKRQEIIQFRSLTSRKRAIQKSGSKDKEQNVLDNIIG